MLDSCLDAHQVVYNRCEVEFYAKVLWCKRVIWLESMFGHDSSMRKGSDTTAGIPAYRPLRE